MFRKSPYIGWLLVALMCWVLDWSAAHEHRHKLQPSYIAAEVQKDFVGRERNLNEFIANKQALSAVLNNRVPDTLFNQLVYESFYVFSYHGDTLKYWNDDDLLAPYDIVEDTIGSLVHLNNNYCIRKVFRFPDQHTLIALIPIATYYPFENEYLHASFDALEELPAGVEILEHPAPKSYPIVASNGNYLYSLSIPETTLVLPDATTVVWTIIAVLFSVIWFQLLLLQFSRRVSWKIGLLLTALLIGLLRFVFYQWPLPFQFSDLDVFSPAIYGYSKLLPSLGDLLLSELCLLWFMIFLFVETPYQEYLKRVKNLWLRITVFSVLVVMLLYISQSSWVVLRSLVRDSQISFNVSHLHNIDANTIIALIAIALGIVVTQMGVRFLNAQLSQLIPNRWLKQLIVSLAGIALYTIIAPGNVVLFSGVVWLTVYMIALDSWRDKQFKTTPSVYVVILSLFTCTIVTINLHQQIKQRDLDKDRVTYASHVLAQQDPLMEYNFKNIAVRIYNDDRVPQFFDKPTVNARQAVVKQLNAFYLNALQNRYQPSFSFYDLKGNGLSNTDSIAYSVRNDLFETGLPTEDSNLVFIADPEGKNYLARLSFTKGILFLELSAKRTINESVYPELLQPATINRAEREGRYAYALYANGKLVTQTSNYTFPPSIKTNFKTYPGKAYHKGNDDELIYQEKPDNAVIVAGNTGSWLSAVVLLSYLFWIYLLVIIIALIYRTLFRFAIQANSTGYHLTLRRRINFSMQSIVLVSFFIVGLVTIGFFTQRYRKARKENVESSTRIITSFIRQYLAAQGGLKDVVSMDSVVKTAEFHTAMTNLAANQKSDANLFDNNGHLLVATREELYEQGLLAPIMLPLAFRLLENGSGIIQSQEYVGKFHYLSCYVPLKNDNGLTMGYVSVPFFSSEKELKDELSNIIVALVNIYALLFLLSSLSALLITSRLTRTFNLVMGRFSNLNLQQNELIEWPYKDEIGLLVNEYNKMARKVEANAVLLAQNERESAWREMAKQVAHEIKNPLTPMKLNIQYLQSALKSKRPDVEALAARVSASIIEQIDNLSYIASEFSNFAKLPEANAEIIDLKHLLGNAVSLHEKEHGITAHYTAPEEPILVMADKSQLLRVFTNLLQNAVQAIEAAGRPGVVSVALVCESDNVIIEIKDNGIGIPEGMIERIFKPYFTTKSSGTGLGLAMTKKIIELWKGTIWFNSVEGEGTSFYLKLPLHKDGL